MRIQHNIPAMNAYRNYNNNTSRLSKNLEKLSSGYKINRAGDDAAGLAISEKMRAQITGLSAAQKNVKDGISLVKTAEGAMQEIHDMLNRMDYLATQSANGTYDNEVDRANLQKEVNALKSEINRIADSANFNGIKLLDGSLDSKADLTKFSDKLQIAEWVGSTNNSLANVGDGTIVHNGQQEAKATTFSVELNNSTVTGDKGVSIKLGDNDALTLDADEIAEGASSKDIAAAIEKKYGKEGVEFLAKDGATKVKFDVKAQDDKIVFTQKEMPKNANEIVSSKLAIKYEGIGAVSSEGKPAFQNTTELTGAATQKNGANIHADDKAYSLVKNTSVFTWADGASNEAKAALNALLKDNTKAAVKVTGAGDDAAQTVSLKQADISALQKELGEGYTVSAKQYAAATQTSKDVDISEKGLIDIASFANDDKLQLTIKDADGNDVGTLSMQLNKAALTQNAGAVGSDNSLETTYTLSAGLSLNTAPTSTFEDGGKLFAETTTNAFTANGAATEKQLSDLNAVLGMEGLNISFQLSGLNGNTASNTTTKLTVTLDEALTDAGYTLTFNDGTDDITVESGKEIETAAKGAAATNKLELDKTKTTFTLRDKDGNSLGTIALNNIEGTDLTAAATTINLKSSNFSKGVSEAAPVLDEKATVAWESKDGVAKETGWKLATETIAVENGDKMTLTVDGKEYSFTFYSGGAPTEDLANGKAIDIGAGIANVTALQGKLATALQAQLDAEAGAAVNGTEDYKKYNTIAVVLNKDAVDFKPGEFKVSAASSTKYTYSVAGSKDGTDPAGSVSTGGKDPNASTTNNTDGQIADAGRLASTYITNDMLSGLKDGSQLKVGSTTYTFAVGKDSKVSGENVIDLKDMTASDKDLLEKAMERLSHADNEMFSIGYDKGRVTFTENKEYKWGEGVDLSTREGIAKQFAFAADGAASGGALTLQIGDTSDSFNQMKVNVGDMHTKAMGTKDGESIEDIDISTQEGASKAVDVIKNAINYVSSVRGDLGAIQNRLEHTQNNLSVMAENIQDAESTIRDTDVADEMMSYVKNNILVQSAQAMLAQANQLPQGVLQLLG